MFDTPGIVPLVKLLSVYLKVRTVCFLASTDAGRLVCFSGPSLFYLLVVGLFTHIIWIAYSVELQLLEGLLVCCYLSILLHLCIHYSHTHKQTASHLPPRFSITSSLFRSLPTGRAGEAVRSQ